MKKLLLLCTFVSVMSGCSVTYHSEVGKGVMESRSESGAAMPESESAMVHWFKAVG